MIKQDLELYRKSTKQYELFFTEDGIQMDITDWSIYFTVKTNMSDTDVNAKIKKIVTEHVSAIEGKTLIELTPDDTNIPKGNYYYSIDYKDDLGNEGVLVSGRISVSEPVLDSRT